MPPPIHHPCLDLELLSLTYFVEKYPVHEGVPQEILHFTTPLRDAKVPVFAVSTWNTDYVLVPKEHVQTAVTALESDGWHFKSLNK
ncbi:hypothetical protein BJ138DRAFT_474413 [Hygrophoropsis aurantiaca]|uniref:Uncharacterized protein n=1 Tax=Hygrophoropsis aurantiaca TaxID=72124 RepID=A0ACB8ASH2_9AGAM|nr:hypothetical protein BJ138DRAFT_474413 [Hygrophoropsis aurantiaca]